MSQKNLVNKMAKVPPPEPLSKNAQARLKRYGVYNLPLIGEVKRVQNIRKYQEDHAFNPGRNNSNKRVT